MQKQKTVVQQGSAEPERTKKFSSLVLYPFPAELDGVSLQGDFLYRGLKEAGYNAVPCDRASGFEKSALYKIVKPDVVIGVGFWGDVPSIITDPLDNGITPVPWLNADGWVANYHTILNELPLIFVTSNWVKETYKRDGVFNKNIFSMPIGIDVNQMSPIPKSDERVKRMREILGVKEHEKMIFTAGGDTTSKGFQEVLRALGKVNSEFKDWKYVGKTWEFGEPEYHYNDEQRIIDELGLPKDRISYIDGSLSRETMRILLSACDVYAAPSRIEGFGMIQVEAMACGIPVLSIDAMGIKDTVVHNKTGFLAKVAETIQLEEEWAYTHMGFEEDHKIKFDQPKTFAYRANVDELAEYLLKLLSDDSLREEMGENGRKHVVENFDYKKVSVKMANIIEEKLHL
ncbi:MAG TPA: glycosyltransferase family 4 protein [archaeon]|nr:glycosyltransferase family 4 protein [archaeon]